MGFVEPSLWPVGSFFRPTGSKATEPLRMSKGQSALCPSLFVQVDEGRAC